MIGKKQHGKSLLDACNNMSFTEIVVYKLFSLKPKKLSLNENKFTKI